MANYNKVILMGNLTRDPELRYTSSNLPVAQIGLAVNDRVKNRQTEQWEERANFFNCVAFGRTAEVLNQYLRKGRPLFIEGQLRYDSWEDKETGAKRSKVEVVINNFEFIDGRGGDDAPGGSRGGSGGGGDGDSGGNYGGGGGGGYSGGGGQRPAPPGPSGPPIDDPGDDIPF